MKVNDMKLLILSDTHRSLGFACEAIEKEAPDAVIHLGDHLGDAEDLSFAYQDPDFYYVPGNCDYAPTVPQMLTHVQCLETIGGVTLLNPGAAGRFGRSGCGVVTISGGTFECRLETDTE